MTMDTQNKLSEEELAVINYRYTKGYDKHYRMHAGMSTILKNYEDDILYLEVQNSEKSKPSNLKTAIQFATEWSSYVKELNNAKAFVVVFYKTKSAGFSFFLKDFDKEKTQHLIDELKSSSRGELVSIFSGLLPAEKI